MKKLIRVLCTVGLILVLAFPSAATSVSEEEKKKDELQNELQSADEILAELENKKADAEKYMKELDGQMAVIEAALRDTQTQITAKNKEIKKNKKKLKKSKKELNEQYASMKKRIKYLYENGEQQLIELFLTSDSISEFLNKAEYTAELAEYDRRMLDAMKAKKAEIEQTQNRLETDRSNLKTLKKEQTQQKTTIEQLMASKQEELNVYHGEIAQTEEEITALKEEIAAQEAVIEELRRIEEERRKQAEERAKAGEAVVSYDGGMFTWPTPGYTTITSAYGYRTDPITGEYSAYHNGMDIGAPYGADIVAAYSGEVAWAYYSTTAGNFIGIDHGDGLYTVYMHCSQMYVSQGQTVLAGETIGLIGSTGRSTGPHLHFGVRLNGEYVDPANYIS